MSPTEPIEIILEPVLPRRAATVEAMALAILTMTGGGPFSMNRPRRPTRPCVVCQKAHHHNNAFCSADCCRAYKSRK